LLLMTALTFIPATMLMMTSFTRIVIVLALLRQAIGTPTSPPNQVVIGLSLFLTFFVMSPVLDRVYTEAYLPLSENRSALVWTRQGSDAQRLAALPDREFLAELQQVFGYRLGALTQVGARHLYPLTLIEAEEQVRSHLVLLGNAAHSLHPIAGQGYNLSLRDVLALADTLLAGDPQSLGTLPVLQAYVQAQRLDQDMTVGFSDRVTRLFSNAQPLLVSGRNLGLLGLDLLPPAKRWFARQAMGLGTRY